MDPQDRLIEACLVADARCGDARALAFLAARWQRRPLAHAMRLLGDAEAARDAVQAGWIDIVRGLPRLDDAHAFPAWADCIVTRRCAGSIRHNQRGRALASALAAEPQLPPEDALAGDREGLHAAIRSLPPDQRAAIALHHFD